ncbi:AraC family transcriptional regulator [Kaistia dalseonensis]|uniref:AraC-like DNA-binding protein n=1 Tax=Kaistia dalseonensis TaxID=410840 RepID=A0ABU0H6D1_9HYPH|nr:AraC family transcriptional regulator [Kaistia dalseonensis]MCX5494490.1 AraC family transcriptional regulator [Kaistia dalseonensis]MDQ0437069.1 AraC-like DNA-binding protein [Kaistia dalseonensis]
MLEERLCLRAPHPLDAAVAYQVVGGGQRTAAPGAAPITTRFHEHAFILSMEGRGQVEVGDAVRLAEPGDMVWLNTSIRYAHGCAPGAAGWSYLWMGVGAGPGLDAAYQMARAAEEPVFIGALEPEVVAMFERGIHALRLSGPISPAVISAAVGDIIAEALGRRARRQGLFGTEQFGGRLGSALERIRADIDWPWTIADMARLATLSPSQYHRLFKQHFGSSPITWLRHERISRACRLLADRSLSVAEVGRRCGYTDPYHFSRDFRRLIGSSPSRFRADKGW